MSSFQRRNWHHKKLNFLAKLSDFKITLDVFLWVRMTRLVQIQPSSEVLRHGELSKGNSVL
jgi:hypothetical protein